MLATTSWLDPGGAGRGGPVGPVTVRFSGRRAGGTGTLGSRDRFEVEETVDRLLPGSGPVSVTAKVTDVTPGEWLVHGRVLAPPGQPQAARPIAVPDAGGPLHPLRRRLWPRGNPLAPDGSAVTARTRLAPVATGPGIVPASWAAAVAAGVALAVVLLAVLLGRVGADVPRALAVSAAIIAGGMIGARLWYVMLQRGKAEGLWVRGLCIQGTIAGGALVAVPALLLAGIGVGTFFDAAAPGLFYAMAVGRQGCFLAGCCTGRPTASRFGIWSSDGRVGVRRVPAQQLEALVSALLGTGALLAFLALGTAPGGAVFAGTLAAYVAARQPLLAARAEPRRWRLAAPVTLAVALAALAADIAVAVLG